jgi:DNA-binding FadR family transcriptional regulator
MTGYPAQVVGDGPGSGTPPSPTAPLRSRTRRGLSDQLATELLSAVARGEYPPGSRLPPEAELAAQANVSRLTLREAVKVLRDKGVLRVEQGRGTFVNSPSSWSALDAELLSSRIALGGGSVRLLGEQLLEARRVVEVGTAGLAARRRTDDDLERLHAVIERMRATHEQGDVVAFSAADGAFHDSVLQAAGNPFLTALFEPIRTLAHQVRITTSYAPVHREEAIAAHSGILDAIERGEPDAARTAVSEHLDETTRALDRGADR